MRKILTQEEREKKESRRKLILGILLAGLMILSTVGFAFLSGTRSEIKKLKYNDIEFALLNDGLWHGAGNNFEIVTVYNPKEVENITFNIFNNLNNYYGATLYFLQDSESEATSEIARNLENYVARIQYACIKEDCEENLPIKSCENDNIISIKESNETLIKQENKCVYIQGKREEIIKLSDAFIFRVFGIV